MALSLLLDENVSPVVAQQVAEKRPDIAIQSLHQWRDGAFLGVLDEAVLRAAHQDGLTLVTYDVQILSDLAFFFEAQTPFGGLIFVDAKTIPGRDFGRLVRALIYLWDRERLADWQNRLLFLPAPSV